MSKAAKTREFIIEKSASVFNTKGYAGTSLSDIMEVTGLTKGSVYGNFENKDELTLAVYNHNVSVLTQLLDGEVREQSSFGGKLFAITGYYRKNWVRVYERGGCPILNAAVEADDNLPFLQQSVRTSIAKWSEKIARLIEGGKDAGEFKNVHAENYAYLIITLIEGGIMLGKITNIPDHLFAALDRIDKIIREEIMH